MTTIGTVFAMNRQDGVTLIELIITVSIIAILVVALGFSFRGWMGRYKVENQIKQLYADLMNARSRAMMMNRMHFTTGDADEYTIYDDTNLPPDGDEILQPSPDCRVQGGSDTCLPGFCRSDGTCSKSVEYAIDWTRIVTPIRFDKRGVVREVGSIYCNPHEPMCCASNTCAALDQIDCKNPDYDCLMITATRINMGKWNGSTCIEK